MHLFNEAKDARARANAEKLKTLTDKDFTVELKYLEPQQAVDLAGNVILSNSEFPVHIESGDRRYVVMETCDAHRSQSKEDRQYWRDLAAAIECEEAQNLWFSAMIDRDISKFNESVFPTSGARNRMQQDTFENIIVKFFVDIVNSPDEKVFASWFNPDVKPDDSWFSVERVRQAWKEWKIANDIFHKQPWKTVFRRVTEIVPANHDRKTHKLIVACQRTCRDRNLYEPGGKGNKRKRCVFINKEEVLNMAREVLQDALFDFEDIATMDGEVQDKNANIFSC